MRRFRRFRWHVGGWLRWAALLVVGCYLVLWLVELAVLKPLAAVAETEARIRAIDATNRVVLGSVGKSLRHEDLVTYEKDKEGRIAAYHINTQAVTFVASEAATAVAQEFRRLSSDSFGVPLGAMFGSRLLSTQGPAIPVKLMPIGSVSIDIQQEFKAAGINQTRHRIWLHATARVQVVLPVLTREVEVSSDLPVTETVIIGPVPQTYAGKIDGVTIPAGP
jgi:sporulation protein YunB